MDTETVVLRGLLRPDGTLDLPTKIGLAPGPVEVTVRSTRETTMPGGDWWGVLQQLRAQQAACGHIPRSASEIDAEINAMRDEWEEHQLAIERMQDGFRQAREQSPPLTENGE